MRMFISTSTSTSSDRLNPRRMEKFRHTFRRWRSAILVSGEEKEPVLQFPPPEPTSELIEEPQISSVEPILDLGAIAITRTWKNLPQEIVDHIVFMLRSDLKSLKACSLTCKAMFVSTRRVIHRKICLTWERNWDLLTIPEKQRYIRGERQDIAVRVLSAIAAHGLLPYARHLYIHLNRNFTTANLQPFSDHFQRFDRIQELSIYWLHTPDFLCGNFDAYFRNFVPTLRSLHLDTPTGDTRDILDFICRFPNLDNLTFKMGPGDSRDWRTFGPLPVVEKMPPFRGRLKLRNIDERCGHTIQQLISLPGKRSFRFVDFRSCTFKAEQPIIDACSSTLESISTTWGRFHEKGLPLNLVDVKNLRSFTLRVDFEDIRYPYEALSQTIHTIASPFFSEFVLEVGRVFATREPTHGACRWWGTWTELDKMFERLVMERGFKVVIRAENLDREPNFFSQAENRLPLMAARKGIAFEIGPFPEK